MSDMWDFYDELEQDDLASRLSIEADISRDAAVRLSYKLRDEPELAPVLVAHIQLADFLRREVRRMELTRTEPSDNRTVPADRHLHSV